MYVSLVKPGMCVHFLRFELCKNGALLYVVCAIFFATQ